MTDFKNKFSWSISQDRTFQTCKRKYYLNRYGSWGGWDKNSDELTRKIYLNIIMRLFLLRKIFLRLVIL